MAAPVLLIALALGAAPALTTGDDYPAEALRHGWQGDAVIAVTIDADGLPADCTVTRSSGHAVLDAATCATFLRRARYQPALNATGTPIASTVTTTFHWRLKRMKRAATDDKTADRRPSSQTAPQRPIN